MFWATVIVAIGGAYLATKAGFYETLVVCFNAWVAIYVGLFLTGYMIQTVPACTQIPFGSLVALGTLSLGSFGALQAVAKVWVTSQFKVPFPKVLDVLGAAALGGLGGFLVASATIVVLTFSAITPVTQALADYPVEPHVRYVGWWCDHLHGLVGRPASLADTQQALGQLKEYIQHPPTIARATDPNASAKEPNCPRPPTTRRQILRARSDDDP